MILLSFLFVFKNYIDIRDVLYMNHTRLGINERLGMDKRSGMDERFDMFSQHEKPQHEKEKERLRLVHIYDTLGKIEFLESENISQSEKLYEIEGRGLPSPIHVHHGGLFDEWNFDF